MEKRKTIIYLIIGLLLGLFIIPPILRSIGIPSFDRLLTTLFGDDHIKALVFSVIVIVLLIILAYKKPKQH